MFLLLLAIVMPGCCWCSGCLFLRDDQTIRCQDTDVQDIGDSLHILTMVVRNRPHTVDIDDCRSQDGHMPDVFAGLHNSTIDTVKLRRSGIRHLHPDLFEPIENSLRDVDLSHNMITDLPEAVKKLENLERLDLQHNRIVFLKPGSGLGSLKELNLAHNFIGQAKELPEQITQEHGYQLKGSLKLEDFSLGRSVGSLQTLNLRGNRLATVPHQISDYSLPELKHLDMSENVIGKIEPLTTNLLPKLEFLDFQFNRIQQLPFYSLPITLKYLDLTENPFHCDCSAVWLFDWYAMNGTTVRLPTCHSPERYKDIKMEKIPWEEQCSEENTTFPFRYISNGSGDYEILQMMSGVDSVTMTWRVRDSNLRWALVYRAVNDPPRQMKLVPSLSKGPVLKQRIAGLKSDTAYVVCVAAVRDSKYTVQPDRCRTVSTRQDRIRTVFGGISASSTSVTVRWQLASEGAGGDQEVRHEWTIRIRRTGSDNYTDIPAYDITSPGETDGQRYEYAVSDLSPSTHYDVCLVDVEHTPIGDRMTAAPLESTPSLPQSDSVTCVTVLTSTDQLLYATEIAAIVVACAICFVVSAVTLFLCRRNFLAKKGKKSSNKYQVSAIPRAKVVGTWNTLRVPYAEFPRNTFRTTGGYRDALTSVTIYKSGYSEC